MGSLGVLAGLGGLWGLVCPQIELVSPGSVWKDQRRVHRGACLSRGLSVGRGLKIVESGAGGRKSTAPV